MNTTYAIVCKLTPGGPLAPVLSCGRPMRFAYRGDAELTVKSLTNRAGGGVPGGGPYYFIEEVQSSI